MNEKAMTIPEQAVEAAAKAISEKRGCPHACPCSHCDEVDGCGDMARVAVTAALPSLVGVQQTDVARVAKATAKRWAASPLTTSPEFWERVVKSILDEAALPAQPGSGVQCREDDVHERDTPVVKPIGQEGFQE
jgi:hypothetical protein